jgi:L-cysteine S-thiosulfotransferase
MTPRPSIAGAALLAVLALVPPRLRAGEIPANEKRSGFEFMSRETQAMQRDDTANPGMLWVREGEAQWTRRPGTTERACADCHGATGESLRGVAARYPAFSEAQGRPIVLEERINQCRVERQGAKPLSWESQELLGLTAFVANQSRGLPVAPADDPRLKPFLEAGRRLYEARQGQLTLSCALCHDDNWGKRLAGNPVPQGHPTGYPVYRLEWQGLGSLQRRLRNCLTGMRAEPYPYGAPEYAALELYLMSRASGLPVETPAVRP